MNIHQNARLTPRGRVEAVRRACALGESARQVARALQVSDKTVRKWVARAAAGDETLADHSSRPTPARDDHGARVALRIKVLRHR